MESCHILSPRQIYGLLRGEVLGPFSLVCPMVNRISHATLTLYWGYGRPLTLRFSQETPLTRFAYTLPLMKLRGMDGGI